MNMGEFNSLPLARAEAALLDCCGSVRWAKSVATQRPYTDPSALFKTADAVWRNLCAADWLEAFCCHPQIGEKAASGSEASRQWSEGEQAGAHNAADNTIERFAEGNRTYREKFGYIFIICATGKSAEEMLAILSERLHNDPGRELHIAAEQQRLITRLRLEKLLPQKP